MASKYLTKSDSWECIVYVNSQDLNFNDFLPGRVTVQALREFRFRSLRPVVGKDLGWGNKNPVRNATWDFDLQTADFAALCSALDALSTDSIAVCSAQQVRVGTCQGGCISLDIFAVWRDLAFSLRCHLP